MRRKSAPAVSDRVLSFLPNDAENIVTQLGTAAAGRIVVSASPETTASPAEVDAALNSLEARMVIFPPKYENRNNIDVFNALDEEIATWPMQVALNLKKHPYIKQVVNTGDQYYQGHTMWRDLMLYDPTPSNLPAPGSVSSNETVLGYINGGQTALFSHGAVVNGSTLFGSVVGLTSSDRMCVASPLYTGHGLQAVVAAVAHAAVAVIPSSVFDPEQVLASLERDVCTVLHISPQQLKAVLDSPVFAKHDLSTLQKVILVGSAHETSAELTQLVERATSSLKVKDVVVAHTANNVAGVLFAGSASQNASNPAAGRLLPHIQAKLVDGGKAAKAGTTGKLYVRGFNVAKGQWGAGAIVDKEGWLDTGLQASASADGLYTIKH
jgi:fatty-acyl-CoA synthase